MCVLECFNRSIKGSKLKICRGQNHYIYLYNVDNVHDITECSWSRAVSVYICDNIYNKP